MSEHGLATDLLPTWRDDSANGSISIKFATKTYEREGGGYIETKTKYPLNATGTYFVERLGDPCLHEYSNARNRADNSDLEIPSDVILAEGNIFIATNESWQTVVVEGVEPGDKINVRWELDSWALYSQIAKERYGFNLSLTSDFEPSYVGVDSPRPWQQYESEIEGYGFQAYLTTELVSVEIWHSANPSQNYSSGWFRSNTWLNDFRLPHDLNATVRLFEMTESKRGDLVRAASQPVVEEDVSSSFDIRTQWAHKCAFDSNWWNREIVEGKFYELEIKGMAGNKPITANKILVGENRTLEEE